MKTARESYYTLHRLYRQTGDHPDRLRSLRRLRDVAEQYADPAVVAAARLAVYGRHDRGSVDPSSRLPPAWQFFSGLRWPQHAHTAAFNRAYGTDCALNALSAVREARRRQGRAA